EIVPAGPPLEDLARQINEAHQEVGAAMRAGLAHARRCGELLALAKGRLPHGGWLPWLRDNRQVSERAAPAYMRVAAHWPELEGKAQHVADLTFRDGLRLLAAPAPGLPEADARAVEAIDDAYEETIHVLGECRDTLARPDVTVEEIRQVLRVA